MLYNPQSWRPAHQTKGEFEMIKRYLAALFLAAALQ
jgi:hypothetical protein